MNEENLKHRSTYSVDLVVLAIGASATASVVYPDSGWMNLTLFLSGIAVTALILVASVLAVYIESLDSKRVLTELDIKNLTNMASRPKSSLLRMICVKVSGWYAMLAVAYAGAPVTAVLLLVSMAAVYSSLGYAKSVYENRVAAKPE